MAKTIGLNITLNGVTTAVSSIKELETEITKAREKLSGLSIGSQEFQNLSREIQGADSKLKNFKKSAEGLESVQQAEAFAKVAGGITTSFAAAQAAVALFGAESEDVTQAITKANQVLTIAIAARGAAEAALNLKIVANTIAQRAQTIATASTNAATKALFTTIASNPIGALVAVLGLAIGALIAFGSESDDAAKEQDKFQDAIDRTNRQLDLQISLLEKTGGTAVQIAEARLKKEQELEEIAARRFVEENTRNRFSEETTKARTELEIQQGKVRLAGIDVENAKKKELEDADKKRDESAKTRSEKAKQRLEDEKKVFLDTYNASIEAIGALRRELNTEVPEPKVIEQLKETLEILKGFAKQVEDKPFEQLLQDFKNLEPPVNKAVSELDVFGQKYISIRDELSDTAQFAPEQFEGVAKRITDEFGLLLKSGEITQVAFNAVAGIIDSYRSVSQSFFESGINPSEYYQALTQQLVATGDAVLQVGDNNEIVVRQIEGSAFDALTAFEKVEDELLKSLIANEKLLITQAGITEDERTKLATDKAKARLKVIKDESTEIIQEEQNILRFRKESQDLILKREKTTNSAVLGFFKQNADKFIEEYKKVYGTDIDGIFKEFQLQVTDSLVDSTTLTAEELAQQENLYKDFYKKLQNGRDDDLKKESEDAAARIALRDSYISGFSSQVSQLNGLLRSFTQESLDALERQNEETLSMILGTTEESNQKRLEQEAIYNQQRKDMEKKAAITELRLTLLQAIADGAAAVIAAAKTPALIPIVLAINAGQISLIASQIQSTQSLQRGGMIRSMGMGGLLEGPSHEQGGIRLAQTGVIAEGGEAVINRVSSVQYRDLLSNINMAGGGVPLVNAGFDDSRLLEALAKQRSEPIRAYVQEQEITNKQAISRRLNQLSSL
jgi:hypothetical protein